MARPRFARTLDVKARLKEDVVEFLKIGGDYHGVRFQTYMQWLLERALLDEVHYYGWDKLRPVQFAQQQTKIADEHHEFLHLNRTAKRRARTVASSDGSDDSSPT